MLWVGRVVMVFAAILDSIQDRVVSLHRHRATLKAVVAHGPHELWASSRALWNAATGLHERAQAIVADNKHAHAGGAVWGAWRLPAKLQVCLAAHAIVPVHVCMLWRHDQKCRAHSSQCMWNSRQQHGSTCFTIARKIRQANASMACSMKHLPEYIQAAPEMRSKGVDMIACVSVNDAFVMDAWGKSVGGADAAVTMLADGNAAFTTAMGTALDLTERNVGIRSQRYSAVIEDNTVRAACS